MCEKAGGCIQESTAEDFHRGEGGIQALNLCSTDRFYSPRELALTLKAFTFGHGTRTNEPVLSLATRPLLSPAQRTLPSAQGELSDGRQHARLAEGRLATPQLQAAPPQWGLKALPWPISVWA